MSSLKYSILVKQKIGGQNVTVEEKFGGKYGL